MRIRWLLMLSGTFTQGFFSCRFHRHVHATATLSSVLSLTNPSRIEHGSSVRDALELSTRLLERAEVVEPEYSSLHLLSHAINELNKGSGLSVRFSEIQASPKRILTDNEASLFSQLVDRRLDHEPIQYILGGNYFIYLC